MKFSDLIRQVYRAILGNKLRSGLTMLGIVIGIGAVIAMVAIGSGAQKTIESNIQALGSNLIMVMPGAQRGTGIQVSAGRGSAQTLTVDDAAALATLSPNIKAVSPEVSGRYQVTARGTNTNTQIVGVEPAYAAVRNTTVAEGTFVTALHLSNRSKVAVIGPTVRDDLFGEGADALGKKIRIKQLEFTVIGVTAAKGGSGFSNPDDMIFVPLSTAQTFLFGSDFVSSIGVQAVDQKTMTAVQQEVTYALLERHKISNPEAADFTVINQSDIVATASSVADTFTMLLGSVAGISLVVGGIGIMNMMLTTVTERLREIGLRKALGARRRDVSRQFLGEALALTLTGGVLGIGVGRGAALLMQRFGGIAVEVSWSAIALAVGVSTLIGVVFGYYPARRAAALDPIEALRYE